MVRWTEENIEKLKNMRESGYSWQEIAEEIGTSANAVRKKYAEISKPKVKKEKEPKNENVEAETKTEKTKTETKIDSTGMVIDVEKEKENIPMRKERDHPDIEKLQEKIRKELEKKIKAEKKALLKEKIKLARKKKELESKEKQKTETPKQPTFFGGINITTLLLVLVAIFGAVGVFLILKPKETKREEKVKEVVRPPTPEEIAKMVGGVIPKPLPSAVPKVVQNQ